MKNKKFTIGMIVKYEGKVGVINAVDADGLDGERAAVVWVDGTSNAWYELDDELEILQNPIQQYQKQWKKRKVYITAENGEVRTCKPNEDSICAALESFLDDLHICDCEYHIDEMIENDATYGSVYYNLEGEEDTDWFLGHELKLEIK